MEYDIKLTNISILLILFNKTFAEVSPCPKYFLFEPDKSEDDKWYGLVTLKNPTDLNGVSLELHFDKPVTELGNWFGKVTANPKNTEFTITNSSHKLKANVPENIEIFVTYDPFYDNPFPQLKRIRLNNREICPNEDAVVQNSLNTTYINFPNCGRREIRLVPLIVHGETSKEGEWPWHTAIYAAQGKNWSYICGGTLISNRHILTAAHCTTVDNTIVVKDPKDVRVILGKYELNSTGKHEQIRDISRIIVHSDFNRKSYLNDISKIITNPFTITEFVKPACLWLENTISVLNQIGFAIGWGRHNKNYLSNILMEAKMPVIDRLQCILANPTFYSQFTSNSTLCAGYRNGTSVCNGDSGSGLFFQKDVDNIWEIRGIVSTTIAKAGVCDPSFYVIFTDVTKYLDWIKTNINQ